MTLSRRTLRAALALVIGILAACSDAGPTAVDSPAAESLSPGSFHLVSINGRALPYLMLQTPAERVEIASGDLDIQNGWGFKQVLVFGETTAAGYAQRQSGVAGTYEMAGSRIRFRVSTGEEFTGARLPGGHIEYTVHGNYGELVFLFERD
jgi:hypothetical protein